MLCAYFVVQTIADFFLEVMALLLFQLKCCEYQGTTWPHLHSYYHHSRKEK